MDPEELQQEEEDLYLIADYVNREWLEFTEAEFRLYDQVKHTYGFLRDTSFGEFVDRVTVEEYVIPYEQDLNELSKQLVFSEYGVLYDEMKRVTDKVLEPLSPETREDLLENTEFLKKKYRREISLKMWKITQEYPYWKDLLLHCVNDDLF